MTRFWCSALLLAAPLLAGLAGCGKSGPQAFETVPPDELKYCEREAVKDPAYSQLIMIAAAGDNYYLHHQQEFIDARKAAITKCLRARGVFVPGGVERVQRQ